MKKALVTTATIAALLAAGASIGSFASEDERGAKRLKMEGTVPLSTIVKDLESKGYTRFAEIEFEHGRYEVKGRRSDGKQFKVYVDAHTGKIRNDND